MKRQQKGRGNWKIKRKGNEQPILISKLSAPLWLSTAKSKLSHNSIRTPLGSQWTWVSMCLKSRQTKIWHLGKNTTKNTHTHYHQQMGTATVGATGPISTGAPSPHHWRAKLPREKRKKVRKNEPISNSAVTVHVITLQTTMTTTSTRTTTDSTLFHILFCFPSLRRPPGRTDGQRTLLTQQSPYTHISRRTTHLQKEKKTITAKKTFLKR